MPDQWALPLLAMVAILPNPWDEDWASTYTVPPFFTDSAYRSCLDPGENLSPGQSVEIDRVYRSYPHLNDDTFVREHLDEWLR